MAPNPPLACRGTAVAAGGVPLWFLRLTCDRCGEDGIVNETHAGRWRDLRLNEILARTRHHGCGGLPGRAELLTGIESASSRPVRRIVLREG